MDSRWAFFRLPVPAEGATGLLLRSERAATGRRSGPAPRPLRSEGRLVRSRRGIEAEAYRLHRVTTGPGQPPAALLPRPRR